MPLPPSLASGVSAVLDGSDRPGDQEQRGDEDRHHQDGEQPARGQSVHGLGLGGRRERPDVDEQAHEDEQPQEAEQPDVPGRRRHGTASGAKHAGVLQGPDEGEPGDAQAPQDEAGEQPGRGRPVHLLAPSGERRDAPCRQQGGEGRQRQQEGQPAAPGTQPVPGGDPHRGAPMHVTGQAPLAPLRGGDVLAEDDQGAEQQRGGQPHQDPGAPGGARHSRELRQEGELAHGLDDVEHAGGEGPDRHPAEQPGRRRRVHAPAPMQESGRVGLGAMLLT